MAWLAILLEQYLQNLLVLAQILIFFKQTKSELGCSLQMQLDKLDLRDFEGFCEFMSSSKYNG